MLNLSGIQAVGAGGWGLQALGLISHNGLACEYLSAATFAQSIGARLSKEQEHQDPVSLEAILRWRNQGETSLVPSVWHRPFLPRAKEGGSPVAGE